MGKRYGAEHGLLSMAAWWEDPPENFAPRSGFWDASEIALYSATNWRDSNGMSATV